MNGTEWEQFDSYLLNQKARVLHQIWFWTISTTYFESQKLYRKLKKFRDSWKLKNIEWCHVEWSKDNCYQLVKNHYPHHLDMYKNYTYDIQRCDAVRYFILHRYGGVYVDMDYYCNRSLDEVMKNYTSDIYLVQTPNKILLQDDDYVSNSYMISRASQHPFWLHAMIEMEMSKDVPQYYGKHLVVMLTAGPSLLNKVYHKYKHRYNVKSLPSQLFQPYGIRDELRNIKVSKEVYAVHINQGSWAREDTSLLNIFIRDWSLFAFILVCFVPGLVMIN